MLNETTLTITYKTIQMKSMVIYNYHLWTKISNAVMIFWEWIKSILNIEKVLAKVSMTRKKYINQPRSKNRYCKRYYIIVGGLAQD